MRTSYLAKVLLLLLGLVLLVELSSYTATRLVVRDTVTDNARRELQRGGEVFAELIQARAEQLSLSAEVLTDDFGFKEAVRWRMPPPWCPPWRTTPPGSMPISLW